MDRAASVNGASWLISTADRNRCAGLDATPSAEFARLSIVSFGAREAGTRHRQLAVVCVKPFREPELARHVRVFEIEGLQRLRTNALDVPGVKELVGDRAEHAAHVALDRRTLGNDRAVAVLHAVAAAPRHVVAKERVGAAVELRQLAEDRRMLADDPLGPRDVLVDVGVGRIVVNGRDDRLLPPVRIADLERTERLVAQLGGAVHQYCRFGAVKVQGSLVGNSCVAGFPLRAGRRHERDPHGPRVEAARPHQGGRHVHVRMRRVDTEVGPVDAVAEHLVHDSNQVPVLRQAPLMRVRPDQGDFLARRVVRLTSKTFLANSCSA